MRLLEIILLLLAVSALLGLPRRVWSVRKGALIGLGVLSAVFLLHALVEGLRWQMVPAYALAGLGAGFALLRLRRAPLTGSPWLRWPGRIAAVLAGLVALALPAALPVPDLPSPRGDYAVGAQDFVVPSGDRRLLVRAFYPAAARGEVALPYLTKTEARELSARLGGPEAKTPGFLLTHMALIDTAATVDAEPAEGPFPALVFSHGYSGIVNQSTAIVQDLVSRGWVVFAIGHDGGAAVIEYPDGSLSLLEDLGLEAAMMGEDLVALQEDLWTENTPEGHEAALRGVLSATGMLAPVALQWSQDQSLVLERIDAGAFGAVSEITDTGRVGVLGHSFGGSATALTCARDERCDAALNLDGMQYGGLLREAMPEPFLMLYMDHPNQGVMFNDLMYRADPLTDEPFRAVLVEGAGHHDATDLSYLLAGPLKAALPENPALGPIRSAEASRAIAKLIDAYFREALLGEGSFEATLDEVPQARPHRAAFSPSVAPSARTAAPSRSR